MNRPKWNSIKRAGSAVALAVTYGILFFADNSGAQSIRGLVPVDLPPLGWTSWNSFSNTVDASVIMAQAKAMISRGLHEAGYQYVNIDEGWWHGDRDEYGNIVVDPKAWPALAPGDHPGDMSNIVRYIHSLGLKAGIYTDAGVNGCSTTSPDLGPSYPFTGSEGHYEQDFLQFAKWGFDYVKVDWCGGSKENLDPAFQYAEIARAIIRAETITHHRLYFSICEWGNNSPWTWASNIGGMTADIWRTSSDIVDPIVANTKNSNRQANIQNVLSNFDRGIHPEAQHTGSYNDPDMLVIGMRGLSDDENRVHMSLWAMSGAPLLIGADLTKLSDATLATLTNAAVLAVDQDALGLQAVLVAQPAVGLEVWSKPLAANGQRAVLLLNRTNSAAPVGVRLRDFGLVSLPSARVLDIWKGEDLGIVKFPYSAVVPANDAIMLIIHGSEGDTTRYLAAQTTKVNDVTVLKNHPIYFVNVATDFRLALVRIVYRNPNKASLFADLRVNGQLATRIAFPPTGRGNTRGSIWIQSLFDRKGANNVLTFSTSSDPGPAIDSIYVE